MGTLGVLSVERARSSVATILFKDVSVAEWIARWTFSAGGVALPDDPILLGSNPGTGKSEPHATCSALILVIFHHQIKYK